MATNPDPEPLAALVARTWRECGQSGTNANRHALGAVVVYDILTRFPKASIEGDSDSFNNQKGRPARFRLEAIDSFPGIRSALVGALVEYLIASNPHKLRMESYGKGMIVQVSDWRGSSIVDESDATDPLRALCLAALAVKKAKGENK